MIDRVFVFPPTVSQCPTLTEPNIPLSLRLEGIKLGQRAIYRCPMGYILQGTANATCLASGESDFVHDKLMRERNKKF